MLIQLGEQNLTVMPESSIQTLYYTLERIKIFMCKTSERVESDKTAHRRERQRLLLTYNVLREALRYRRNNMHNEKEEDIVKVVAPLIDALNLINNQ